LEWNRARRPTQDAWDRISDSLLEEQTRQQPQLERGKTRAPRPPK
jgi:hypothetical protein